MSTIRVDNFGPSAGGTTYSARGIAKAWVNFNGTGTIAARDSENVSSLTDDGTGKYTTNFSSSFSAADYCATTAGFRSLNNEAVVVPETYATGSLGVGCTNGGGAEIDFSIVNIAISGDLA